MYYSFKYAAIVTYILLIALNLYYFIRNPLFFWNENIWYTRFQMIIELLLMIGLLATLTAHFYLKRRSQLNVQIDLDMRRDMLG